MTQKSDLMANSPKQEAKPRVPNFKVGQVVIYFRGKKPLLYTVQEIVDGEYEHFYRIDRKTCLAEHMLRALTAEEAGTLMGITCGPQSAECKRECPDGPCEHKWDGPEHRDAQMFSATCSRCGMLAFSHSMWVGP